MEKEKIKSSFRDPSGFVFVKGGELYRKINDIYFNNYNILMNSGLYEELTNKKLLIPHIEIDNNVIKPQKVFISYPYEWCFSQYKDTALATLEIEKTALKYDMTLKDASAYNIQFYNGNPILIDTLSFEKYEEGSPWIAYKQFCQHFLAPLALMTYTDIRLSCLMKNYIDGIPLDLASKLLPFKTKFIFGLLTNIHLHAKSQQKYQAHANQVNLSVSKFQRLALIDSLIDTVKKLKLPKQQSEWGNYYTFTNYNEESFKEKKNFVQKCINMLQPSIIWDLGANIGTFSRLASETIKNGDKHGNEICSVISLDIDPIAVEKNYNLAKQNKEQNILPLVMDFTNPSPSIGFANEERDNLQKRAENVDIVMALALIHHLAISNNLPFENIAEYFSRLGKNLIIEFVDKKDSQIQLMLSTRKDIFTNYTIDNFEAAFNQYYKIVEKCPIKNTYRTMYLMRRSDNTCN